jgi:ABC-type multidrug transport system fused ATPase/permease subunit
VGPSGSGKSTIVALLTGAYEPSDGGAVLVDGKDLKDLKQREYRRLIGVVEQDS